MASIEPTNYHYEKRQNRKYAIGTGKRLSTFNDRQLNLEHNGSKVNFTSHYKYLGVHQKPKLNRNDHKNKAFKKVSGYLKLLAKNSLFPPMRGKSEIVEFKNVLSL